MKTFWLSFAGDDGFRGVVLAQGRDFMNAIMEVNLRGLNPGGEVKGIEIPGFEDGDKVLGQYELWRVYSKEDMISIGDKPVRWEDQTPTSGCEVCDAEEDGLVAYPSLQEQMEPVEYVVDPNAQSFSFDSLHDLADFLNNPDRKRKDDNA